MTTIEIPDHARDAVAKLAARRRHEDRRRREREREDDARRRAATARRRRRLLPIATRVMEWAQNVAATGVLDDLGDAGLTIYRSPTGNLGHRRAIAVRGDGALVITARTAVGGARWIVAGVSALVERARSDDLQAIDAAIESNTIWDHLS